MCTGQDSAGSKVSNTVTLLAERKLNPRNPDHGLFGMGVSRQAAPALTPVPHLGTTWSEASIFRFLLCKGVTPPLPVTWGDGMSS